MILLNHRPNCRHFLFSIYFFLNIALYVTVVRGYDYLREHQYDICQAVLAGRDVFVLMATGMIKFYLLALLYPDDHVCGYSLLKGLVSPCRTSFPQCCYGIIIQMHQHGA